MTIPCTVKNLGSFMLMMISCTKNLLVVWKTKGMKKRQRKDWCMVPYVYFGAFGKSVIKELEYSVRKRCHNNWSCMGWNGDEDCHNVDFLFLDR